MGMSNKSCHAELVSASILYLVFRSRNKFGMTLCDKLISHPRYKKTILILLDKNTLRTGSNINKKEPCA